MPTMDTNRMDRLKGWIAEFDSVSAFCRRHNLPISRGSFLSQVLSGHRNFGERAARKLEAECGRPQGWLDEKPQRDMPIRLDMARIASLPAEDRELIKDFANFVVRRRENSRNRKKIPASLTIESVTFPKPEIAKRMADAAKRPLTEEKLKRNERPEKWKQRRTA